MRTGKNLFVLVVCIAALMLTLGIPASASAHVTGTSAGANWGIHTIVVAPNHHDDTANLQAAFNTCTTHNWVCSIQLVRGTYYTDQIYAIGFQGSFAGAGSGLTVVQALPNMPSPSPACNTGSSPFWACAPGPTNPWPNLFTFVNGAFQVSGISFNEPYAAPTQGWYAWGATSALAALDNLLLVTGTQATATIDHITLAGGPGDAGGWNMGQAICYCGMLLPAGWVDAVADALPISGSFSLVSSSFYFSDAPLWVENTLDASVTAAFNVANTEEAVVGFFDISATQLWVYGNYGTNISLFAGVGGVQSVYKTSGLLPSTVYVEDNVFLNVNDAGDGVVAEDLSAYYGEAPTLSAVVSGNIVQTDVSCGCYLPIYGALDFGMLSSFVASNNLIIGGASGIYAAYGDPGAIRGNVIEGASIGIWLDAATGINVTGNWIKNSPQYGIEVTDGSSNIVVSYNVVKNSGLDDLYWDQTGTNDLWYGNIYATSSPATLP